MSRFLAFTGALLVFLAPLIHPLACAAEESALELTSAADRSEARNFKSPLLKMVPGKDRPKIGLALGGGGARGAAHVGAISVLDRAGIKFDYVTGTSIGSVVGGFYCAGVSPEAMYQEVRTANGMRHFMTVPLWFRIVAAPLLFVPRIIGFHPYDGLYGGNSFRKYLVAGLTADQLEISSFKTPFAAIVLNLLDGKPYMIRKGNLGYALQASCAVPSLRKPVEIEDKLLVDGGVVCNLPVKQCRQMGADFVIAVNIDEPFRELPPDHFRKAGSVAQRMISWGLYDIDDPQELLADIVIHPDTTGISLISTSGSDARKGYRNGVEAAKRALPEIKAKLARLGVEVQEVSTECGAGSRGFSSD